MPRSGRRSSSAACSAVYGEVLDKAHPLQGIARIRFGHALLAAGQSGDAEAQSRAGYDLMVKRSDAPAVWMTMARQDLATVYRSLGRPAEAERFQAELATAAGQRAALSGPRQRPWGPVSLG